MLNGRTIDYIILDEARDSPWLADTTELAKSKILERILRKAKRCPWFISGYTNEKWNRITTSYSKGIGRYAAKMVSKKGNRRNVQGNKSRE